MLITYGKTAYINTSSAILDHLSTVLNTWSEGQGSICVNAECLNEVIEPLKKSIEDNTNQRFTKDTLTFLEEVRVNLEEGVGDIVFRN